MDKTVIPKTNGKFYLNGFRSGLQPEKIISMKRLQNGKHFFLMQWKETNDTTYVKAKTAKKHCPLLVIEFYEKCVQWKNN